MIMGPTLLSTNSRPFYGNMVCDRGMLFPTIRKLVVEVSNREHKSILEKTVDKSGKNWSDKPDDAL